jgi:hypothetical protein
MRRSSRNAFPFAALQVRQDHMTLFTLDARRRQSARDYDFPKRGEILYRSTTTNAP